MSGLRHCTSFWDKKKSLDLVFGPRHILPSFDRHTFKLVEGQADTVLCCVEILYLLSDKELSYKVEGQSDYIHDFGMEGF